jgi:hypothetical protein
MAIPAHVANQGDISMSGADAEAGSSIDQSLRAALPATHHQLLLELQNSVGTAQKRSRSSQSQLTCVDMNTGVAMTKIDTAVVADTAFASLVPHDAEFSPEKQRLRSEVYALERYLAETQQHSQEWVRHTQFTCEQEARRLFEMQQANFELAAGSAMAEARDVLKLEQAQLQSKFDQQSFSQQEDHRNSLHVALNTSQ